MPIASINPTTEETLQSFEALTDAEIDARLDTAHRAALSWRLAPVADRAAAVRRAGELLEERKLEYGRIMTLEMGKPLKAAVEEAAKCATACYYYADHAERFLADEPVEAKNERSYVAFQPIGVVLAVMPWNFPFWQVIRFAAPALCAGNVGVLKHASNVPQCALKIEDVLRRAGFPDGAFQTLLSPSSAVEGVIEDDRVRAVTLTGSEP
ncbi:MAG TPA: aldehyde dehydrogenase family protein, partial [Gemmatimonadaceae bacterium]|nr:aldehyde dehydrogenase family protein [Gemmatimonadaceae bacterium]